MGFRHGVIRALAPSLCNSLRSVFPLVPSVIRLEFWGKQNGFGIPGFSSAAYMFPSYWQRSSFHSEQSEPNSVAEALPYTDWVTKAHAWISHTNNINCWIKYTLKINKQTYKIYFFKTILKFRFCYNQIVLSIIMSKVFIIRGQQTFSWRARQYVFYTLCAKWQMEASMWGLLWPFKRSWLSPGQVAQLVGGSHLVPGQGTYLGFRFDSWLVGVQEATDWCLFLSLSLPPSLSLKSISIDQMRIKNPI